jgi:hypothetical protein
MRFLDFARNDRGIALSTKATLFVISTKALGRVERSVIK